MVEKALSELARAVSIRKQYGNFIGGKWVAPVRGQYFDNISPVNGKVVCTVARSTAEDIELALDAAHAAKDAWGSASYAQRSIVLNKIADRMEEKLATLALVETLRSSTSRVSRKPPRRGNAIRVLAPDPMVGLPDCRIHCREVPSAGGAIWDPSGSQ